MRGGPSCPPLSMPPPREGPGRRRRVGSGGRADVGEAVDVTDAAVLGHDDVEADECVRRVGRTGVPLEPGLVVMSVDLAAEAERDPGKALLGLLDEAVDLRGPPQIHVWIGV